MNRTDTIARRMLDATELTITPTPHTFSAAGDRAIIVASNGRILGWVAMTSGAGPAVGALWANAAEDIGWLMVENAQLRAAAVDLRQLILDETAHYPAPPGGTGHTSAAIDGARLMALLDRMVQS